MSVPLRQKAYQPFGDLRLHFPGHETATDYRRELDLDSAVATVSYRVGDVRVRASGLRQPPRPGDRLVHVTGHRPVRSASPRGSTARTSRPHGSRGSDQLALTGQVEEDGMRFEARLCVRAAGRQGLRHRRRDLRRERRRGDAPPGRRHELQELPDITADPAARCEETMKAVPARTSTPSWPARGRPPAALPPRVPRPRPTDAADCPPTSVWQVQGRARSPAGGPVLPVRPLPADRQLAARAASRPTCRASGTTAQPAVGQQVHGEHQHGDELLAGRGRPTCPSATSRCST